MKRSSVGPIHRTRAATSGQQMGAAPCAKGPDWRAASKTGQVGRVRQSPAAHARLPVRERLTPTHQALRVHKQPAGGLQLEAGPKTRSVAQWSEKQFDGLYRSRVQLPSDANKRGGPLIPCVQKGKAKDRGGVDPDSSLPAAGTSFHEAEAQLSKFQGFRVQVVEEDFLQRGMVKNW